MEGIRRRIARLHTVLRRQGRTREDAEDLIQEAFLRLHQYCRDENRQDAFLARTVRNLSIDLYRREHRDLYVDEPVEELVIADARTAPDEECAHIERLQRVGGVLATLSPRTREIFLMHRIEGYGCAAIARHFQISVSAVEKHIAKAVLTLMDAVANE